MPLETTLSPEMDVYFFISYLKVIKNKNHNKLQDRVEMNKGLIFFPPKSTFFPCFGNITYQLISKKKKYISAPALLLPQHISQTVFG